MKDHPIYQLLSAVLACAEANLDYATPWFYGDRTPVAESVIRQWAADHADRVLVSERRWGLVVDCRKLSASIVNWYPSYEDQTAAVAS